MEVSGLLDAWVSPYGGVALPGHDTQADVAWAVPAPGPSLLDVLRPEPDAAVPADIVSRLLTGSAFGLLLPTEYLAAIGADGGSATGTWSKSEPVHIGSVARERVRHRRIAELTERLSEVNDTIAVLDGQVRDLRERRSRLEADLAARRKTPELGPGRGRRRCPG
ncbi:hypothetical protein ACIOC1_00875 [Streptomyces sp. NPDC088197]|uniref:hypothetical protein n=1 Tax=Streptomyces sp. NPDC088197 TaxID=3365840 RepID=UPI0038156783